ncbi:hypothetical protein TTHERM_000760213 (macronuclear) [Tetrahymena thermophila SB210]|uniref:Uncharacterized protein n=1 Tax=Tetrahymena thermophila (strain SB210) TaxID=312017 RepID=W7XFX3_TETTS|nr:hypothetical protein TTHERM_000760213 [Tetrahymena thermophila SB210]EWS71734.1 hypothetical protein TTHERM_000760213 [Tetrahymena thermophila SB210]|eukprot:XP_012655720.1 hypothetical protein TTHERM_000760213 [Tetrahymena thermophila SB210]
MPYPTPNSQIAISYNNCITILSSDFYDLKLVVYNTFQIQIYQITIDQQQQQSKLISQLNTQNQITYVNCVQIFTTDQDVISNQFIIEEILTFDNKQNFDIYNFSLELIHQVPNVALISVNQAKRVINDDSVYFLVGFSATSNPVVRIHAIQKNSTSSFENTYTYQHSPFIDDPIKIVNDAGKVFYHVKHIINIIYTCGHDYVQSATQITQTKMKIGSNNNYLDYVGTQQGLSCALKYQFKRYQVLDNQYFMSNQHQDDEIQEVIQRMKQINGWIFDDLIYSLIGTYIYTLSENYGIFTSFEVQKDYIIFHSSQYVVFLNKINFSESCKIQAPSGLSILNYLFIKQLSQIILYTNNSLFAQIYVYNIPSQSLAGKIIGAFNWNKVGLVVQTYYDENVTKLSFLDDVAKKVLNINLGQQNLQNYLLPFLQVIKKYNF